ncbi:HTH_Tnp_Tc3_2 domain-containing protein [Trichonephila clavipes]|nr:HTH_Tnp_Tc3_2 domain-containing protein [Trichonephila clavipes]
MTRIVRHSYESVREGYIRNGSKEVKLFKSALKDFQCNNRKVMARMKHLDDFLRDRSIGRLKCGRTQLTDSPQVTTPNEDRYIYLAVTTKRNKSSTASDLSPQLSSATGMAVSRETECRRLGHIGLYARRPVRCVPLTETHCHLRLIWSREHGL